MMPSSTRLFGRKPGERVARSIRSSPPDGGTRPEIALSVVDLPAPLAPINATISPASTSMSRPRNAGYRPVFHVQIAKAQHGAVSVAGRLRLRRRQRRRRRAALSAEIGLRSTPEWSRISAGLPSASLLAVVEHRDAVAGAHHHFHVMLDQHDGHAGRLNAADQADQPPASAPFRPAAGSSSRSSFGRATKARAISSSR